MAGGFLKVRNVKGSLFYLLLSTSLNNVGRGTLGHATRFTLQELLKGPYWFVRGNNKPEPHPGSLYLQCGGNRHQNTVTRSTNWFRTDSHSVTRYRRVPHRVPTTMCCTQQYHRTSEYFQYFFECDSSTFFGRCTERDCLKLGVRTSRRDCCSFGHYQLKVALVKWTKSLSSCGQIGAFYAHSLKWPLCL